MARKRINRTYLVTGATKGIGAAIVNALAEEKHHIIGIARKAPRAFPGKFIALDLADANASEFMLNELAEQYEIDGVVNNVGIVKPNCVGNVSIQDLHEVYDLSVRPALQAIQAFAQGMTERQFGRFVNITSRSILGALNRTSYSGAKGALTSCTRTWALELADKGITVNAVAPGPTETALFRHAQPVGSPGEQRALASIPLGRLAQPREIADAVCFLLSDKASYITGQTLHVDGGGSLEKVSF